VPREIPLRTIPLGPGTSQQDPVVQTASGPLVSTSPGGLSFAGVGDGDYGFVPNAAPPDTNGAVGATQYVQWVNESFAVFDKTTGAILTGFPVPGNTLWSGFGGGCEMNNDGDPIVQYDKLANRWVFTQFSVFDYSLSTMRRRVHHFGCHRQLQPLRVLLRQHPVSGLSEAWCVA
jgi:hypothetical protein